MTGVKSTIVPELDKLRKLAMVHFGARMILQSAAVLDGQIVAEVTAVVDACVDRFALVGDVCVRRSRKDNDVLMLEAGQPLPLMI